MKHSKILSKKTVFQSTHFFIENIVIERENKKVSKDIIRRWPIAIIIPYTKDGEIYLESQYRDAFEKNILEIVAGHLEPNEDPLLAAKRELQEETGITARTWKK